MEIFDKLIKIDKKSYGLLGLTDESFCVYVSQLFKENDRSIVILTSTLLEATNLLNSLTSYTDDVLFFPMDDFLTSMAVSSSPELLVTRLETLNEIIKGKKKIIITHIMSYLRFLPTSDLYKKSVIELKTNYEYDIKKLGLDLLSIGYKRDTLVYKTGDVAIRGYIIDVFPIGEEHPVRIEFFGDEIDSIRYFDEETQLSLGEKKNITIYPATDLLIENSEEDVVYHNKDLPIYNKNVSNIVDYLDNYTLIIKDYSQLKNTYNTIFLQMDDIM